MHGGRKDVYSGKVGLSATEELKVRLEVILGASLMWYLGHDVASLKELHSVFTKYVPDVVFRQCFKFVAERRQNPDERMSNDHKLEIVNSMLSFHLGWHDLILVPKITLLMFSCVPYASTHIMISWMVSKLTLMKPTMCIRSLGLEGNFCFNKSWAVKSITALAI